MPSMIHDRIVEQNVRKLESEGWISVTEKTYRGRRFDIIAINLETKEIKAIEVQMNGQVKPQYTDSPIPIEYVFPTRTVNFKDIHLKIARILMPLTNPIAIRILLFLEGGTRSYMEILASIVKGSSGLCGYYMRKLSQFVNKTANGYELNDLGQKLLVLIREIDVAGQLETEPTVRTGRVIKKRQLLELVTTAEPQKYTFDDLAKILNTSKASVQVMASQNRVIHLISYGAVDRVVIRRNRHHISDSMPKLEEKCV